MTPDHYRLALIMLVIFGTILFTFAINYTSKPLSIFSLSLSAFLLCLCSIFTIAEIYTIIETISGLDPLYL